VARREWVGYVRDTRGAGGCASSRREERHKLHDILPLPIALNGEAEERDKIEPETISLSGHLWGVSYLCREYNTWTT
jgi:hypothetical protein